MYMFGCLMFEMMREHTATRGVRASAAAEGYKRQGKRTRIISRFAFAIGKVARRCATGKASSRQISVIRAEMRKVFTKR